MRIRFNIRCSILLVLCVLIFYSCGSRKELSGYYEYNTICLGVDYDGNQTVKAFGTGKFKAEAIENGRKKALKDVIFKGIREGKEGCTLQPIISTPNFEENNRNLLNEFFSGNGAYKSFASFSKTPVASKVFKGKKTRNRDIAYEVIVKIKWLELNKYFNQ